MQPNCVSRLSRFFLSAHNQLPYIEELCIIYMVPQIIILCRIIHPSFAATPTSSPKLSDALGLLYAMVGLSCVVCVCLVMVVLTVIYVWYKKMDRQVRAAVDDLEEISEEILLQAPIVHKVKYNQQYTITEIEH